MDVCSSELFLKYKKTKNKQEADYFAELLNYFTFL